MYYFIILNFLICIYSLFIIITYEIIAFIIITFTTIMIMIENKKFVSYQFLRSFSDMVEKKLNQNNKK